MSSGIAELCWSTDRAPEALEAVAEAHLSSGAESAGHRGRRPHQLEPLGSTLESEGEALGLRVVETSSKASRLEETLRACAPALLRLPSVFSDGTDGLLAVGATRKDELQVLTPSGSTVRVGTRRVRDLLLADIESSTLASVDSVLDRINLSPTARHRVTVALGAERLASHTVEGIWLLTPSSHAPLLAAARHLGLHRQISAFLFSYVVAYALLILSWWTLGKGALSGDLTQGWLVAWALLLATLILPRLWSIWSQSKITALTGILLRRRLLTGALDLDPQAVKIQGIGQAMSQSLESEAIEVYLMRGGFLTVVGLIELAFAVVVLVAGAGGWLHAGGLALWVIVFAFFSIGHLSARRNWLSQRLRMTHDLVENMVGHRTRLAQQPPKWRHTGEDDLLAEYHRRSLHLDRYQNCLFSLIPRGWLVLGIGLLAPAFVAGAEIGPLAAGVGGILMAFRGFSKAAEGSGHLASSWVSWEVIRELVVFETTKEPRRLPTSRFGEKGQDSSETPKGREVYVPLLEAREITFRHQGRAQPALAGSNLRLAEKDRVLLQGSSGSGKSTLASILAAQRKPEAGILLYRGFDHHAVGWTAWRKRVVLVPQFHENHVYAGSLAFNLLLGRRWPARPEDLQAAWAVCKGLGLEPLLQRMPGGLFQPVGDTGWQLSHGERSRIFLARALLQEPDVLILDEAFAALDPQSLRDVNRYVRRQDSAVLLIAHV